MREAREGVMYAHTHRLSGPLRPAPRTCFHDGLFGRPAMVGCQKLEVRMYIGTLQIQPPAPSKKRARDERRMVDRASQQT